MKVSECHFFSKWKNSMTPICLICTSMSGSILSDCPSAAICHTATKFNEILVGRLSVYCHPANIQLWCRGSMWWIMRHYFQSSPCNMHRDCFSCSHSVHPFCSFLNSSCSWSVAFPLTLFPLIEQLLPMTVHWSFSFYFHYYYLLVLVPSIFLFESKEYYFFHSFQWIQVLKEV